MDMKNQTNLLLLFLLLLTSIYPVFAADEEITNSGSQVERTSFTAYVMGQSFTATKTGLLTSIGVVSEVGGLVGVSGTATLNVYEGAGDGGSILYTKTGINFAGVDTYNSATDYSFHYISIENTVNITSGNVYTFVFTPDNSIDLAFSLSNIYAGGELFSTTIGGLQAGEDMIFSVIQSDAITAPVVVEVTPAVALGSDSTPDITFSTTESGNLAVGGSCGSGDEGAVSAGNNTITLTQTDNSTPLESGTYSDCTVMVSDNGGNTSNILNLSSFVVDVTSPIINANADLSLNEGNTAVTLTNTTLSSSDNMSTTANVTYTLISTPINGTLKNGGSVLAGGGTFTQANIDANALTYNHNGSETLSDTFTFTVSDGVGNVNNNSAFNFTFNFTITAENDAPTAVADSASTSEDTSILVDILNNDSDIDGTLNTGSVTIVNAPSHGTTSIDSATGKVTYTPEANFHGADSFVYTVKDNGSLASASTTVSLTITAVNDTPVISGEAQVIAEEGVSYSFTPTVSDSDSDAEFTFSIIGKPNWADFDTSSGSLNGIPSSLDIGVSEAIVISVSDGEEEVSLTAFIIEVIAGVDTDGDGVSDFQEGINGTNPNDSDSYLDEIAPVITALSDVDIDATGLFTDVTKLTLLGLSNDATEDEIETLLLSFSVDNIEGVACCTLRNDELDAGLLKLPPGRHEIEWYALDKKDNKATTKQVVNIHPQVSFGTNIVAVEGSTVKVPVLLNGFSPVYPINVPIIISDLSSAIEDDYTVVSLNADFERGEVIANVTIDILTDNMNEGSENILIGFAEQDDFSTESSRSSTINQGANNTFELTITEENITPSVALAVNQADSETIHISKLNGLVTVTTEVVDPNINEVHSFDWSATDSEIVNLSDSDTVLNNEFIFDPSVLEVGTHEIHLQVTDSQGATDTALVHFVLEETRLELSTTTDTDGDGIDDYTEGLSDDDYDGIPNYLDNIEQVNVLPSSITTVDSFLLECEPGLSCRMGQFSLNSISGGARLDAADIASEDLLIDDELFELSGGIFDFVAVGSSLGGTISIVVPQVAAIPEDAVYRKFHNGVWETFVENSNNTIHSSKGELGFCPPPNNDTWEAGLVAGYYCVQLTIEDGGPNDTDGSVNSTIADPGSIGVAKIIEEPVTPEPEDKPKVNIRRGTGGSVVWLLLVLSYLIVVRKKKYKG